MKLKKDKNLSMHKIEYIKGIENLLLVKIDLSKSDISKGEKFRLEQVINELQNEYCRYCV